MNELPREARWSLAVALCLGLLLAGLGAGIVAGGQGIFTSGPTKIAAGTDREALRVDQSGTGTGIYSATNSGTAGYFSSQGGTAVSAITATGSYPALYAQSDGAKGSNGSAVVAKGLANDGVLATTTGADSVAVLGQNSAENGVAIFGSTSGTGTGVLGVSQASHPGSAGVGVAGATMSFDGAAIYGVNSTGSTAGYFSGSVAVTHDLVVGGAVVGFSGVVGVNVGSTTIKAGDAVALSGFRHGAAGQLVVTVTEATKGQKVLGIADCAAFTKTIKLPTVTQDGSGNWHTSTTTGVVVLHGNGNIAPGSTMLIATSGIFSTANVDASGHAIAVGDALAPGAVPGQLVEADASAVPGTIVGEALGTLPSGTGIIPILISIR